MVGRLRVNSFNEGTLTSLIRCYIEFIWNNEAEALFCPRFVFGIQARLRHSTIWLTIAPSLGKAEI